MPRMMIDVSKRNLTTLALGSKVSMPIGISPTAMQRMAHPDGECASAKAAEKAGTIFILSTISTSRYVVDTINFKHYYSFIISFSIEEVAMAAPKATKWFQLYIYKDRKVTKNLVKRAEAAGFKAIVLTVDAPYFGRRLADIRNKFKLPPHLKMANFIGLGDAETQSVKLKNSKCQLYFFPSNGNKHQFLFSEQIVRKKGPENRDRELMITSLHFLIKP